MLFNTLSPIDLNVHQ